MLSNLKKNWTILAQGNNKEWVDLNTINTWRSSRSPAWRLGRLYSSLFSRRLDGTRSRWDRRQNTMYHWTYLIGNGGVADATLFLVGEAEIGPFCLDEVVFHIEQVHLGKVFGSVGGTLLVQSMDDGRLQKLIDTSVELTEHPVVRNELKDSDWVELRLVRILFDEANDVLLQQDMRVILWRFIRFVHRKQ